MDSKKVSAVYARAANGMLVRVPRDKLQEWKKAQDNIAAKQRGTSRTPPPTEGRM